MRRVKTDRSVLIYFLLSLVTCGIYGLFFVHRLAADVNEMCKDDGKNTQGLLVYILLSIVTCGIYGIVWWFGVAERVSLAAQRRGVRDVDCSGATFLLWYLLGVFLSSFVFGIAFMVIAYYKLFDGCNKVGEHYNRTGGTPLYGGYPPYGGQPGGQPPYGNGRNEPPVW